MPMLKNGPGEKQRLPIFGFLACLMVGKPIPLCGHPQQCLSFMGVVGISGVRAAVIGAFAIVF
jgi:hypothetical protein